MAENKSTESKKADEKKTEEVKTVVKHAAPPSTVASLLKHAERTAKNLQDDGVTITVTVSGTREYHGLVIPDEETHTFPKAE